jgi:hypothetical protein
MASGPASSVDVTTTVLVGIRFGFAAATWVAPRKTARLFGIDVDENPMAPYLGRLFGSRDGWMGAEVLLARGGDARRQLVRRHMAVEVADLVGTVIGWRAGYLSGRSAALTAFGALCTLGVAAAAVAGGVRQA